MPGVSGVTVVTTLVCYLYHCTRGCGRIERPAFPAPSDFLGREFTSKTRASVRRDREAVAKNEMSIHKLVMPGLDPGIHPSSNDSFERMDHRVKPGDDERKRSSIQHPLAIRAVERKRRHVDLETFAAFADHLITSAHEA